jgi:hypothetical protein
MNRFRYHAYQGLRRFFNLPSAAFRAVRITALGFPSVAAYSQTLELLTPAEIARLSPPSSLDQNRQNARPGLP